MAFYPDEIYIQWMDQLAEDDFVVLDHFIDEDLFQLIFNFFEDRLNENDLKVAGIGALGDHTINKKVRGDFIFWLDRSRDEVLHEFYERVDELIIKLKTYCFLPISDFEFHLAHYPPGTFYEKHIDQFKERNNRLISFVLYLNPNWQPGDGGELLIHKKDKVITINPLGRRLLVFKSDKVEHEVAQTAKNRYSLTGWLLNNPVGLGFLQNS
ncbi:MAG: 2OG-Fe(II) oxygenase [Crocinitomicaceae bacterium]